MLALINRRVYNQREVKYMFADKLRILRMQKGLSQQALGEAMGVSATSVYKWEQGKAQPDIDMLRRLSAYFGVTIDDLCGSALADDERLVANVTVMTRAFRQLTKEEQDKFLAVGRALFEHAFAEKGDGV